MLLELQFWKIIKQKNHLPRRLVLQGRAFPAQYPAYCVVAARKYRAFSCTILWRDKKKKKHHAKNINFPTFSKTLELALFLSLSLNRSRRRRGTLEEARRGARAAAKLRQWRHEEPAGRRPALVQQQQQHDPALHCEQVPADAGRRRLEVGRLHGVRFGVRQRTRRRFRRRQVVLLDVDWGGGRERDKFD